MTQVAELKVLESAVAPASPLTLSRIAAALLLVAAAPFWIFAAAILWASIGRPLLFRQVRCGSGGRTFTIVKLRTMREARDADGVLLPDAVRETGVTRLMRRLRIDELPQLVSIARGDMAFVGPRPLLPATVAGFGDLGALRCAVKPGLTGWAQVNGNTRLTDRDKLALDIWYVNHRNAALDLRILVMTVWIILRGERVGNGNLARARAEMPPLRLMADDEVTP